MDRITIFHERHVNILYFGNDVPITASKTSKQKKKGKTNYGKWISHAQKVIHFLGSSNGQKSSSREVKVSEEEKERDTRGYFEAVENMPFKKG